MMNTDVFGHNKFKIKAEPYLLIAPAVFLMLLVIAYPTVRNFYLSFFKWDLAGQDKPFIWFDNYKEIILDEKFLEVIINTFVWTVSCVVLQMSLGLLLAVIVDGSRKSVQGFLKSAFLLPWIIPTIVTGSIWQWMLQADLGILNIGLKLAGIIRDPVLWLADEKYAMASCIMVNVWKGFPFWFIMLLAGLQSLSKDQIESAVVDGAPGWKVFFHIKIPHLLPIISVTAVLTTIWTLNAADLFFILTKGGPGIATTTLAYHSYLFGFQYYKFGKSATVSIISMFLVFIISLPYLRMTMRQLREGGAE